MREQSMMILNASAVRRSKEQQRQDELKAALERI